MKKRGGAVSFVVDFACSVHSTCNTVRVLGADLLLMTPWLQKRTLCAALLKTWSAASVAMTA
jgi:predicted small secreted protein